MMSTPVRRAWALSLLWIAVIVVESFGGSVENTGHLLYPLLKFLFPKISFLREFQIHYFLRKTGHFLGYSILSLTLYRSWWTTLMEPVKPQRLSWRDMFRAWSWRAALLSLAGTLAVAGFDEWHQSLVPGRTASVLDVALDELGGFLAQLSIVTISSVAITRKIRQPNAERPPLTSA
jgi:VanZ family protein